MRVAITGVSGVIGTAIHDHLKSAGFDLVGIDQPKPATQAEEEHDPHTKYIDITCDLSDPLDKLMANNPFEGCDVVIHLAADARPKASFMEHILPNNIVAMYNTCELCKCAKVKRMIFASTNHVQFGSLMGDENVEKLDESKLPGGYGSVKLSDYPVPDSYYGVSKLFGENIGCYYARIEKAFEFLSLRIGYCLYDDPNAENDSPSELYLKSMWLSKKDCANIFEASLTCTLRDGFGMAYAISNNTRRVFDLTESNRLLQYTPQDNSEDLAQGKVSGGQRGAGSILGSQKPVDEVGGRL